MKVRAKKDAGIPARKWIQPVAGRDNKKVWPVLPNGVLAHGGPVIVKGEIYEVPDSKFKNLKDLFEQYYESKKEK